MMVWRVANTDCALCAQTEEMKLFFTQGRDFGFSVEILCDEIAYWPVNLICVRVLLRGVQLLQLEQTCVPSTVSKKL